MSKDIMTKLYEEKMETISKLRKEIDQLRGIIIAQKMKIASLSKPPDPEPCKKALEGIVSMSYESEDAEKTVGEELHHKRMVIVKIMKIAKDALSCINRASIVHTDPEPDPSCPICHEIFPCKCSSRKPSPKSLEDILEQMANYYFYKRIPPKDIKAMNKKDALLAIRSWLIENLPAEKERRVSDSPTHELFNDGWNACLSEVRKRLLQKGAL